MGSGCLHHGCKRFTRWSCACVGRLASSERQLGGVCLECWMLTLSYLKVRLGRDGGALRERSAEWGHSHMHTALHAGRTNSGPLAERLRPSCRPNPLAGSALAKASPAYKPDSCIGDRSVSACASSSSHCLPLLSRLNSLIIMYAYYVVPRSLKG